MAMNPCKKCGAKITNHNKTGLCHSCSSRKNIKKSSAHKLRRKNE